MQKITLYFFVLFMGRLNYGVANCKFLKRLPQDTSCFKLSYVSVGFGSNLFELRPRFTIRGKSFVYTSEEMWEYQKGKKTVPKILQTGVFRTSSIDSIADLINAMNCTAVFRMTMGIMSGSGEEIEVSTASKEVSFKLHNASDTTAEKIVTILNSYIADGMQKLWLFDFTSSNRKNLWPYDFTEKNKVKKRQIERITVN